MINWVNTSKSLLAVIFCYLFLSWIDFKQVISSLRSLPLEFLTFILCLQFSVVLSQAFRLYVLIQVYVSSLGELIKLSFVAQLK